MFRSIAVRSGTGCLVLLVLLSGALAQDQSFQEWRDEDRTAFSEYNAAVTRQYDAFIEQERQAYQAFVAAAGQVWGAADVWVPESKVWVQYSEDLEERSGVDFESGGVQVQVVVPSNSAPVEIEADVARAVAKVALSGTEGPIQMFRRKLCGESTSRSTPSKPPSGGARYTVKRGDTLWGLARKFKVSRQKLAGANGIDPDGWLRMGQVLTIPGVSASATPAAEWKPSQKPLLRGQLRMKNGVAVSHNNADAYAREVVARGVEVREVKGSDGRTRRVAGVKLALVPEHVRVRAERFRPLVDRYARQYGVLPSLVYAIMETESSFNPRARSHVPAYGLMQLVPRSGARDAYRFVHKKDRLLPASYLFDPGNNVELGCAFVHILQERYLRKIENPLSRMFCAIAAYNTGAGNVARAFTDTRSVSRAAPVINRMNPEQIYARLRRDLPYAETRSYIKKVADRIPQYKAWN